ncbi:hypothetical protein [Glycomyces paridis]|uniref:Uncharacterized protein n=1 Tax=Glycomyces paridis TaxID=2126555 RepID=A0A4S8NYY5_9ACTN|nr:hypothetical protein [Glycomyces paridis]THV22828.1 hypothetical protein E9998_23325 [Glycomyces paridis]
MPAKSKHMERRKQRIANAKKNARLAGKLRRRRQLQALFGLLAIAAVLTLGYLWQSGFFTDEPEDTPTGEVTDPMLDPSAESTEAPAEGETSEAPAEETPSESTS